MPNMNSGMTSAQGRVVFHQERLFRSTGAGCKQHAQYIAQAHEAGLPDSIEVWSVDQCKVGLQIIERVCSGMRGFRDINTDWRNLQ